jgi:hypothetical protein
MVHEPAHLSPAVVNTTAYIEVDDENTLESCCCFENALDTVLEDKVECRERESM